MHAAVVTWKVLHEELDMDKLSEAANWVIEAQLEGAEGPLAIRPKPTVYFRYPCYPHIPVARGGNQTGVMSSTGEFAMVVTDEPITEQQANEVMAQYYKEDDVRGQPYRTASE
jgi:hypothetical protein